MRELLSGLLVLGCLIAIIKFMLGGRDSRVGRPPSGIGTRYLAPNDSPIPAAALGGYALGTAIVITDAQADSQTGILIGAVVAVFMAFRAAERLTVAALGIVGFVCALIQMAHIVRGETYDALESGYRLALVLLAFACFVLGTLVFNRASALKGERGLALLGIVDILGFLARPTGTDLFNLDEISHLLFLFIAGSVAFALGWAVSEATLGIIGIAVVGLAVMLDGPDGWLGVVAAVSAVGFTAVARAFTGRAAL